MTVDAQNEIARLEQKIASAWAKATAWKGNHTEHYRMGCILAASWETQLSGLLKSLKAQKKLFKFVAAFIVEIVIAGLGNRIRPHL